MKKYNWRKPSMGYFMRVLLLMGFVFGSIPPGLPVQAADSTLTVTPITWNITGLDSNNVMVGPNLFPVGARVCNTSGAQVENVTSDFTWVSDDPYIKTRTGTNPFYHAGLTLAAHTCTDFYYEVEIVRNANAYTHTRRYVITAAADGGLTGSSPIPREIYVERLVSQNRNTVSAIYLDNVFIPSGGTLELAVGKRYKIDLVGSTSTNGYNQLESFISLPNTIFQIHAVKSTYSVSNLSQPHDRLYADSCGWDSSPLSPTYNSCILSDGKTGGVVTTTYTVTVVSGAGSSQSMNTMLFDFSGSSYHYNSDFSSSSRVISIVSPFAITKSFSPTSVSPGGNATLTFTLINSDDAPVSGISFDDPLPGSPGQMKVSSSPNATTSGCGSPTFAPAADETSLSFSNGTIAAYGTCIVSVQVTVPATPTTGTYENITSEVKVDGVGTGMTARASLNVAQINEVSSCGVTLASWTFPAGTTLPNPAYTTKASDVSTASATVSSGLTSNQSIDTIGNADPNSWQARGGFGTSSTFNATTDQYFQFQVDTSKYSKVKLSFNFMRGASGPTLMQVYYGSSPTPPQNAKTSYPINPTWSPTGEIDFTNLTNNSGSTYFFIYGYSAANNGANSTLNIDDVTITGCQTPQTLTKSFYPEAVAVNSSSQLTFTLTNSNASPYSGVNFSDALPSGLQLAASPNPTLTGCGSPAVAADPNGSLIRFSNGTLAAYSSCTLRVDVTPVTSGSLHNVSGYISSTEGGTNASNSGYGDASLAAIVPPVFTRNYLPNAIYTGDDTALVFSIRNNNPVALTGVNFSDVLTGTLLIGTGSLNSSGCDFSSTPTVTANADAASIGLANASIGPGETCTLTIPVAAADAGSYTTPPSTVHTAVAGISAAATDDTLIVKTYQPAIALSKQIAEQPDGPWSSFALVAPGASLYYRLIVENTGDVDLSAVRVSDPLLDLSACIQFTNPLSLTLTNPTASCVVGPITAQEGFFTNRAAVEGTYNSTQYSDSATAEYVAAQVDPSGSGLTLMQQVSISPAGPWSSSITNVPVGTLVYYKFTVINLSGEEVSDLQIDASLVNTSGCDFIDPLVSESATVCLTGPITSTEGIVDDVATARSGSNPSLVSNQTVATYASGEFSISGVMWNDASGDGVIDSGEDRFLNASLRLYQDDGDVTFDSNSDLLLSTGHTGSNGEYVFGSLPSGAYFVVPDDISGYVRTYNTSPLYRYIEMDSSNNNFGYQLIPPPDLTVSKTNSTSADTTGQSDPFTWVLLVTNDFAAGPATFTSGQTLLIDELPTTGATYTLGTVDPSAGISGNISCSLSENTLTCDADGEVTIPGGDAFSVPITVTATTAGVLTNPRDSGVCAVNPEEAVFEGDLSNNACSQNSVTVIAPPSIALVFDPGIISLSENTTLTFTLTNPNADIGLLGVGFNLTLPSGLSVTSSTTTRCDGTLTAASPNAIFLSDGALAGGGTCTFALTVTGEMAGLKSVTTGAVTSINGGTGNQAEGSITVVDPANPVGLEIAKSHTGDFVRGSTATYSLVVSSLAGGGDTSGTVTVSDTLPAGLTLHAQPSGTGWTCSGSLGDPAFECERSDSLLAGASYPAIMAVVDVGPSAANPVTNTAWVSGGGDSTGESGSDSAAVADPVFPAVLSIVKSHTGSFVRGETGRYTLVVSNEAGAGDTSGEVMVTDTLPAGLTVHAQPSGTGWTCTGATGEGAFSCTRWDALAGGASYPAITAVVDVSPNAAAGLTNVGRVSGGGDPTPDSSSDPTTTVPPDNPSDGTTAYLPIIASRPPEKGRSAWDLTLGYEDMPLRGDNDYDYNDWTVQVIGTSQILSTGSSQRLQQLDLAFIPKARGGGYSHSFRVEFPAGVFASDGTATLTRYNQDHQVISTQELAFTSSATNTYVLFADTSEVLPGKVVNAREDEAYVQPRQYAGLQIAFETPFEFTMDPDDLSAPHGEGLFFNPVLQVWETGNEVGRGDQRILNVPSGAWFWPEEGVRIDYAYPLVDLVAGTPPEITFAPLWWQSYNYCVYGDGTRCGTPGGR